ncbi:C6 transcription factor [Histoplasma capsulatum]|uniref:C6 transcription factor n=1 Tax=Ajellomyces capsulatus TaxID=5037 RepID=A0A8A1LVK6_AJECA|nr:C6 transcription factor [Histoplasma capsulatum]
MSTAPARVHKRAYQACIPCRERRVRCDLGSVDSPHDGPCGRCRRERKICHFSATRGKRKASTTSGISRQTTQQPAEGYLPQSERPSPLASPYGRSLDEFNPVANSLATRGGNGSQIRIPQEIIRQMTSGDYRPQSGSYGGEKTVAALLRDAAYTSHDALKLLWEAGRHSERERGIVPGTATSAKPSETSSGPLRPSVTSSRKHSSGTDDPRQPWSNLRFVRTGLFTAEEAMDLVNYFHAYLAPFTPVSSSSFQDPSMHPTLLVEEPILAVTILMLASRYMKLSGPGSISRSYMVHERLWQHLQGMISRMIFGQEQFAGATHDNGSSTDFSGQAAESALAGSTFGSLRTLGTCEALLLLSEWHPRSLNVPAGDDGDSIIVKDEVRRTRASTAGIGGRIRIDWLEPVWRSDRMCWSMLGNALALAVELGIFDEYDNTTIGARESRRDIWNDPSSSQRAYRVQHLLWVYLTQTSGRLGWKNLTSVSVSHHEASLKHGDTIRCWIGVASLMKRGNELLFTSRERTKEMVRSGEYLAILRILNPLLREWQMEFDRAKLSKPMRAILSIEYGYVRVSINSVALQAIIEHRNRVTSDGTDMRVSSVLNTSEGNSEYFMEVVLAARSILQTVVDDLVPNDHLRHVPIRTYSRILAGAMFCLKAFALGDKDEETVVSLELVERTADALCTCVVDDVHLSNRFGELLSALATSLRSRVMRAIRNENYQSENMTPGNTPSQRQDRATADIPTTSNPTSYDPPADSADTEPMVTPKQDYNLQNSSSVPAATGEPSAYQPINPANGIFEQSSFHQDPLMSFAGLGPNQLGWTGGQDFFDMLGPLLDVQYEQYR